MSVINDSVDAETLGRGRRSTVLLETDWHKAKQLECLQCQTGEKCFGYGVSLIPQSIVLLSCHLSFRY